MLPHQQFGLDFPDVEVGSGGPGKILVEKGGGGFFFFMLVELSI